jgi:membrane glycosyltransferase
MNNDHGTDSISPPAHKDGTTLPCAGGDPTNVRNDRCFDERGVPSSSRLKKGLNTGGPHPPVNGTPHGKDAKPVAAMPPIRRTSMVPSRLERHFVRRLWDKISTRGKSSSTRHEEGLQRNPGATRWRKRAQRRRIVLALVVCLQTVLAIGSLARTFPYPQLSSLELAILAAFAILFSWISFSFWAGVAGFCMRWRNVKSVSAPRLRAGSEDSPPNSRTAVLVPICNEEVGRVFAGIEATYRSLAGTGQLEKFDFYFLSDTSDPEKQVEEEIAWERICQNVDGVGKIFYRRRRNNIKRKSGNIADFIRRWGRNYDYMIVFDADSIMAGETLVSLACLMDGNPQVGILQTAPTIVNRESLFARVQQFASRVYGPLFSASLHFWQLGESYYWGHNAILRISPFAQHCGLARLPGKEPLGGDILSHDFVEAALMGRAGWEVWLVYDLPGSFEESPPTILDEFKRDRRWCQGNIQHLRLICSEGIRFGHRAIMGMGVMAYVASFLWAVFLLLTTAEVAAESLIAPTYFASRPSLFPIWPEWHPEVAAALLSTTAVMLFLPKFLSVLLIVKNREASQYGGGVRLGASVVLEIIISTLLAPVRMWFHAKYVILTLLGRKIKWGSQCRDGVETGWREALAQHGLSMIAGLVWMGGVFWLNPLLAWWVLPVAVPISLSAPLSVLSSRPRLGLALRRWGLLLIPEEVSPPDVIRRMQEFLSKDRDKTKSLRLGRLAKDAIATAVRIAMLRQSAGLPDASGETAPRWLSGNDKRITRTQ